MLDPDDMNVCEDCGLPVSCQGSDEEFRYHHENPRHRIRKAMRAMTPQERVAFVRDLPFCLECGDEDPEHTCQCWNDE